MRKASIHTGLEKYNAEDKQLDGKVLPQDQAQCKEENPQQREDSFSVMDINLQYSRILEYMKLVF